MYVGIAQAPGALDVIDTVALKNVKTIPVKGAIHNVYVTPDGKFAVAGSIAESTISIVDTARDEMVRTIKMSAGIRPMTFDTNPDGSTKRIFVQLSGFHGFAAVDFATGQEVARIEHPAIPGVHAHNDGLQGAPAHGLGVTPDGKQLWSTSKVYGYAYVHSLAGPQGDREGVRRAAPGMDDVLSGRPSSLYRRRRRQSDVRRRHDHLQGSRAHRRRPGARRRNGTAILRTN